MYIFDFRKEGDRRRDDEINSFERFRNSLTFECDEGDASILQVRSEAFQDFSSGANLA